jgi:hypothetical protein
MTSLQVLCDQTYNELDLRIQGGEGSCGSEGFIALSEISTQNLLWLAYFDCSNPFEKVSIEQNKVYAISNLRHIWPFPMKSPENFDVSISK